jgi:HSP20 family molecular chaperone IbpA
MSNTAAIRPTSNVNPPERVEHRPRTVTPLVDVFENANEILLLADVPGAVRDGVEVHVDKGQLTLFARRAAEQSGEGRTHHATLQAEQPPCDYHRVFTVPSGIDATKIEAELSSGVLKVTLPKSEALRPRRIQVKAS